MAWLTKGIYTRMADNENAVIALLDDLNARMHRQRQRARWLIDRLPDKELRKLAPLIEDMIRATIEAQDDLKALRQLERNKTKPSGVLLHPLGHTEE